jgi:hypothetical protein
LTSRPQLVLRLHPKNELIEFSRYIDEFDSVSQEEPALEFIYAADCVFGMTTMLMLEAAILGRATFSIVPRQVEREWLPSVHAGLTESATTRREIRLLLPKFLDNITSYAKDPSAHFVFGAAEKIVSIIKKILTKKNAISPNAWNG